MGFVSATIVKDGERYYVFGTHMTEAASEDLIHWQMKASGVTENNSLFKDLLREKDGAYAYVGKYQDGKYAFWAPDVIYNETMGKWTMYFSVTKDYRTSSICMATADDIGGPYIFQERLVESGFDAFNVWQSNFYDVCGTDAKITKYQMLARYHQMFLNEEGWFVTAPFAAMGEKLRENGYRSLRKLAGAYYTVEHGRDISSEIHEAEAWKFLPDGTVETADGREGTWDIIKNTCYIIMTLQDHIYKGVIIEMQDEAGNDVRCFTMAGDNNETIWAVFYK